ncbi:MAG: addiction module killer protein [Deltaproteobacteria bacterium RIFOXYA12_FULL_58_15]|nr:MAG: addiction module killer protein [Deltaproteobacteria bacterium RIFOXYA12_FULL_58_15]
MKPTPRELVEYLDERNRSPFGGWLRNLRDSRARALIRKRLNRVRLGNLGDHRAVGDGVNELRIAFGPGYRVYFGEDGHRIVVLLCGGDKRSQESDIQRAKSYWADYWR